jgi:branched-subunit amino acid aminotransferase/4-amino-4-deoxychorismate lyase
MTATPQDALLPDGAPRPDAARGVGTTLLVAGGRVHDLQTHLDRLDASARTLYGVVPSPALRDELERLGAAGARVRVEVRPAGSPRVRSAPFDPPAPGGPPVGLVPFTLPGGLGAHSWNDRRLADELRTRAGDGALPLLLDTDGEVLEAVGAAVLIVEGGQLIATRQDDRRLPSVSSARLPVSAREPIGLARLRGADSIVVVSSLHGVRAASL